MWHVAKPRNLHSQIFLCEPSQDDEHFFAKICKTVTETTGCVCVHRRFSACLSWACNISIPFNQGHREELMTHSSYRYGVLKELSAMPSLAIMLIGLTGLETLITS